jgi:hypothetical protein
MYALRRGKDEKGEEEEKKTWPARGTMDQLFEKR